MSEFIGCSFPVIGELNTVTVRSYCCNGFFNWDDDLVVCRGLLALMLENVQKLIICFTLKFYNVFEERLWGSLC